MHPLGVLGVLLCSRSNMDRISAVPETLVRKKGKELTRWIIRKYTVILKWTLICFRGRCPICMCFEIKPMKSKSSSFSCDWPELWDMQCFLDHVDNPVWPATQRQGLCILSVMKTSHQAKSLAHRRRSRKTCRINESTFSELFFMCFSSLWVEEGRISFGSLVPGP